MLTLHVGVLTVNPDNFIYKITVLYTISSSAFAIRMIASFHYISVCKFVDILRCHWPGCSLARLLAGSCTPASLSVHTSSSVDTRVSVACCCRSTLWPPIRGWRCSETAWSVSSACSTTTPTSTCLRPAAPSRDVRTEAECREDEKTPTCQGEKKSDRAACP